MSKQLSLDWTAAPARAVPRPAPARPAPAPWQAATIGPARPAPRVAAPSVPRAVPRGTTEALVAKYMRILGVDPGKKPRVVFRDRLGSHWLGRATFKPWALPNTSLIEIQKSVLTDPPTFERVLAHEMVHHAVYMSWNAIDLEMMRGRRRRDRSAGHGEDFLAGAALVNAVMGPGFVTEKSDESYKLAPRSSRKFFVMVMPSFVSNRWGWAWAARMTPRIEALVARCVDKYKGRLFETDDVRFAQGARLGSGKMSIGPTGSEDEARLRALYETGRPVLS